MGCGDIEKLGLGSAVYPASLCSLDFELRSQCTFLYPQKDLNLHFSLRRGVFYPLNYRDENAINGVIIKLFN